MTVINYVIEIIKSLSNILNVEIEDNNLRKQAFRISIKKNKINCPSIVDTSTKFKFIRAIKLKAKD